MKNKSHVIVPIILITLICLLGMFCLWSWKNPFDIWTTIDYQAFGTYGDFFGGVIGTLFAIVGVIYIYYTYMNQLDFQKKDQIESRFFELLKLHEKNVEELKNIDSDIFNLYIKNINNFVSIIKKFKEKEIKNWDKENEVKLGYLYFFYGASEYTSERLKYIPINSTEVKELNDYITKAGIVYNGAFNNFGKYFRQLFQIVTYIDEKSELNYKEKQQYIKSLRVRLNIEEQYLFFLNSIVSNGLDWEKDKANENEQLITKYNLLKNIPKEYRQIDGIDFKTIYPNVHYEFNGKVKSKERLRLENLYK